MELHNIRELTFYPYFLFKSKLSDSKLRRWVGRKFLLISISLQLCFYFVLSISFRFWNIQWLMTSSDQCSQSTRSAVRPECSSSSRHAEAQIRPHQCDTARNTFAAYSAAGNVQTVHHRPQMPTRSSSTIPVRTAYTSLHQRWTSFPAFSNIYRSARAKDVNVNTRTSQFRRLRT